MNLYYFGARYYDPEIIMWTSPDPMDEFWNSYSYVGGNPINLTDPEGLASDEKVDPNKPPPPPDGSKITEEKKEEKKEVKTAQPNKAQENFISGLQKNLPGAKVSNVEVAPEVNSEGEKTANAGELTAKITVASTIEKTVAGTGLTVEKGATANLSVNKSATKGTVSNIKPAGTLKILGFKKADITKITITKTPKVITTVVSGTDKKGKPYSFSKDTDR